MKVEYRTPAGTGSYTALADEASTTLLDKVTGYSARPEGAALFRGGLWAVSFTVDQVHASPDAALLFVSTMGAVFAAPTVFKRVGLFDLKITVGSQVIYVLKCGATAFQPAPLSDRGTQIAYGFAWGSYSA